MRKNNEKYGNLNYLNRKPKIVKWKVVAPKGAKLSSAQDHDVIFDAEDRKMRGL